MRLCAVVKVWGASPIPGVSPASWVIHEATLKTEPPELAVHLHEDGRTDTHHPVPDGCIRVCFPLHMVQESLSLEEPAASG